MPDPESGVRITATSSCDHIIVQLRDIPGGQDKDLVAVIGEDVPSGAIAERLYIDVNDGQNSTMSMSVLAQVIGDVYATPNTLLFGIVEPGQPVVKEVRLLRRDGDPVSIVSVEVDASLRNTLSCDVDNDAAQPILRATMRMPETSKPVRRTQRLDGFIRVNTRKKVKRDLQSDESVPDYASHAMDGPGGESSVLESINIPVLGVRIPGTTERARLPQ